MKRRLLLLGTAATGLALAGCGGPPPTTGDSGTTRNPGKSAGTPASGVEPPSVPGKYGGQLTTATISDPKTFNLWVSSETSSTDIVGPLYEGLNQRNAYTLKYEARLADLPKVSADGLTYTYTLRDGLKWSDGQPLNADDVTFTLDVLYDPKIETPLRENLLFDVPQKDGTTKRQPFQYRKVDERTVEFKLPVKFAPAQDILSFNIMPRHKLEAPYKAGQFNSTWSVNTDPKELVSSGPWVMKEYVPKQRVVYERNPYFFKKTADGKPLPYLERYVVLIVPDQNTTTLKFLSGDVDVLSTVKQDSYPSLSKQSSAKGFQVINRGPGWGFNYLGFNLNPEAKLDKDLLPLFQDQRFRQAVSHAIDRDRMSRDIFLGLAKPLYGPVSPANTLFFNTNTPKYEYNLDAAKKLLAECGATPGTNGMLQFHGKEVKFNILTNTENDLRKGMATIITADLKKVGLNAQFTPVTFNDLVRRLDSPPYEWDACILGFTGGPEPYVGSAIWRSSGRLHQWHPKEAKPATEWEAEIDKLWTQGAQELDPAKRKLVYDQWQKIVGEQQPFIFTVVSDTISAIYDHYGNLKPASLGLLWNMEEVFDKKATGDAPRTP